MVVNQNEIDEIEYSNGEYYGGFYKVLTPLMEEKGGTLGVSLNRIPPGRSACPFHYHQIEDEVFFMISGQGVLRYGEEIRELYPGDCVSCPAGVQSAHQIANLGEEDRIYLAIGRNDPNEVAVYPDSAKVMVRSLKTVDHLREAEYAADEPSPPKMFKLAKRKIA